MMRRQPRVVYWGVFLDALLMFAIVPLLPASRFARVFALDIAEIPTFQARPQVKAEGTEGYAGRTATLRAAPVLLAAGLLLAPQGIGALLPRTLAGRLTDLALEVRGNGATDIFLNTTGATARQAVRGASSSARKSASRSAGRVAMRKSPPTRALAARQAPRRAVRR